FAPGAGNTNGTLSWTPSLGQAGSYTVTFTASNAKTGSATTAINVVAKGRPAVTAPAPTGGGEDGLLTVEVAASAPGGEHNTSLVATGLPSGANFAAGAGNTSGTLTWTPSFTQAGSYTVTFTASNAKTGSATTTLNIADNDRAPVVSAPPSASGNENVL